MIAVACVSCHARLSIKDELSGKIVKCPLCGTVMGVKALDQHPPTPSTDESQPTLDLPPLPSTNANQETQTLPTLPNKIKAGRPKTETIAPETALPNEPPPAEQLTILPEPAPSDGNDATVTIARPKRGESAVNWPTIPGFEILGELGRGGMGVVFKARQLKLKRLVALKMIRAGSQAGEVEIARFRIEAEAVARLQHANIVQIHEIGEQDGQSFCALEYVDGGTLSDRLERSPQPPKWAAETAAVLATAMEAAHRAGIVHRDLKPANVLMTAGEPGASATGVPKISDFGLAKQLDTDSGQTQGGSILGTPSYMSPEQARGDPAAVRPATDVYALGAILYEMLTGRPPFQGETPFETMRQVREEEPVPPRRLQPRVPRDLETICLKCLAKEPQRRYARAQELADDLHRFLKGEPIRARATSPLERGLKWVRRNKAAAALIGGSAAALLAFAGLMFQHTIEMRVERDNSKASEENAIEAGRRAQESAKDAIDAKNRAEKSGKDALAAQMKAEKSEHGLRLKNYVSTINLAFDSNRQFNAGMVKKHLQSLHPEPGKIDLRGLEWHFLWRQVHDELLTFDASPGTECVAFLADEDRLLSASKGGTLTVWDASTGQSTATVFANVANFRCTARFSQDARLMVVGDQRGQMQIWQTHPPKRLREFDAHKNWVRSVAVAPDSSLIASGDVLGRVRIWRTDTAELVTLYEVEHEIDALEFSPDGTMVCAGSIRGDLRIWKLGPNQSPERKNTNEPIPSDPRTVLSATIGGEAQILTLTMAPGGRSLAVGGPRHLALWDVAQKKQVAWLPLSETNMTARHAVFSPDGRTLAVGSGLGSQSDVMLWDVTSQPPQRRNSLLSHTEPVHALAFLPDCDHLITGDVGGTIKVWNVDPFRRVKRRLLKDNSPVHAVAFHPDGRTLAIAQKKMVRFLDVSTWENLGQIDGLSDPVTSVAFAGEGKRLITSEGNWPGRSEEDDPPLAQKGTVKLWSYPEGKLLQTFKGHEHGIFSAAMSPNGKLLASGSRDQSVKVWDMGSGEAIHTFRLETLFRSVAFSPDGTMLAAGSGERWSNSPGEVVLWNVADGRQVAVLRHFATVNSVAFAPDGKTLAAGDSSGITKVWDVANLTELYTLQSNGAGAVQAVVFIPDGKTLCTCHDSGAVVAWQTATGMEMAKLTQTQSALSAAVSFDQRFLVVGDFSGRVQIVDSAPRTGGPFRVFPKETDPRQALAKTWHVLGNALVERNAVPESILVLRRAMELDPQRTALHEDLGFALYVQKMLPEAVRELEKAIEVDPKSSRAHEFMGRVLREQKKFAKAVTAFEKAIELDPKSASPHNNLGNVFRDLRKMPESIAAYEKAVKLDPQLAAARNNLVLAWLDVGKMLSEQNKLSEAVRACESAIRTKPDHPMAHNDLGGMLRMQNKLPESIASYEKALELNPSLDLAQRNLALAYTDHGIALAGQNKVSEAMAAYHKAIKLDPKLTSAGMNLGNLLYAEKNYAAAALAYEKTIEADPKYAPAHYGLGLCLNLQKKLPEAVVVLRKAIELDPQNTAAHVQLGYALRLQNMLPEAVTVLQKAIELDPKKPGSHHELAAVFMAQRKTAEALESLQKVVSLDPNYAAAHANIGLIFIGQRKYVEGAAAYQQAVALNPNLGVAQNGLGVALRELKKYAEAAEAFEKAAALSPTDAKIRWRQGNCLFSLGQMPEAAAAFRKAVELDPQYAEAYCSLGHALKSAGDFTAALQAMKKGHELGSRLPLWPNPSESWVKECSRLVELDQRLPLVLEGKVSPSADELLELARMSRRYKKQYAQAVRFYQDAFKAQPSLTEKSTEGNRYNAACVAALAGQGKDAHKLTPEETARLRNQAHTWLSAELDGHAGQLARGKPDVVMHVTGRLAYWQTDSDLAAFRPEAKEFATLPADEQESWRKLWARTAELLKDARSRFTETRLQGELTGKAAHKVHELAMTAGRTYSIDMESSAFDTLLRLEDAKGIKLAENDDVAPDNLNSRLVFAPTANGTYRIVATSFQEVGMGPYVLIIREFSGPK